MENKLTDLLYRLAKSGRSTNWSHEQKLTSTREGLLIGEEYCVTVFYRLSCRVDTQIITCNIAHAVTELERYIEANELEWVLNDNEPF